MSTFIRNTKIKMPPPDSTISIELMCISYPQSALSKALKSKNIQHFRTALKNGADAALLDGNTSVFEMACKTAGSREFIEECLAHHCDVNHQNPQTLKYPIHYAVESEDVDNLQALLRARHIDINILYQKRSPLYLLFEQLNENSVDNIFDCIKLLLSRGADINIPDENNFTAIITLFKAQLPNNKKKDILEYCLKNSKVDVDTFRKGRGRALITKNFPDTIIPDYKMTLNLSLLRSLLESRSEERFCDSFEKFCSLNQADNNFNAFLENDFSHLLKLAVQKGMLRSVKQIVEVNPNYKSSDVKDLLATTCQYGYYEILLWLLGEIKDKETVNEDPLLSIAVKQIKVSNGNGKCPFFRCLQILLNDPRVNVDKVDDKGCCALHYAVKYKVDSAAELLLKNSSYIGIENVFSDLPIRDINPKLFENYLDSCITTNDKRPGDDDYEITINFSCFVPPKYKQINDLVPVNKKFHRKAIAAKDEEMLPINCISKSNELQHLLKHPVISSFLFIKWLRLSFFFYVNLLMCTIFFVSFVYYVVGCYGQDVNSTVKNILWTVQLIGTTYLALRELTQFVLSPRTHLLSIENVMEIALICLLYTVLISEDFTESNRRLLSSIIILLAAFEFTLLVGALPILSISTHMVMLKTVSKNFLKSLVLYSIILIAFAFCFYTLFSGAADDDNPKNGTSTAEETEEDQFNTFADIRNAILKTLVMLTGEFEAANIKFNVNGVSYVVFVLFVFFVSIVLFNLINGLAVSDTTAIKAQAELIGLSQKVEVLTRYEKAVLGCDSNNFGAKFLLHLLPRDFLRLFPNYLPLHEIIVYPNDSNKIMIPKPIKDVKNVKFDDAEDNITLVSRKLIENEEFKLNFGCCLVPTYSRMDGKIVKYAKATIHNRMIKGYHEEEIVDLKERLTSIENKLQVLLDTLSRN